MACPKPSGTGLQLIDPTKANLPCANADQSTLNQILSDVFVLLGALAVLMIVVAGLRYILARGNPEKITQARNIILYSVIGLIISSLAYTIVTFVLNQAG